MTEKTQPEATDLPERSTPLAPAEPKALPQILGSTFAERAAARAAADKKAVSGEDAEDKAVSSGQTKSRRGRK